jgi:hypothetical protein
MSTTVLCPQGHAVMLDDPARSVVACPRCQAVFAPGGAADLAVPPLPGGLAARPERRPSRDEDEDEAEDDDRPRRRRRRDEGEDEAEDDDRPRRRRRPEPEEEPDDEPDIEQPELTRKQRRLAMVRLGILFHIIKLWTYLAAMIFGLISLPLVLFLAIVAGGWVGRLLNIVTFNLSMTIAPILGIIGSIMCAWVPPRSEARGTIIVSMIFDLLAPVFGLFQLVMFLAYYGTGDVRIDRLVDYMFYARLACTLVAWWLFQLYLRKVAFYINETLMASEALNVIVHFLIATIIGPTLVVVTFVVMLFGPCIAVIVFFVTLGYFIYFLVTFPIRQFRLLFQLRKKIYDKFLKPEDDDDY